MLFWKYLQVLTEIKTDIEKVHEQAICGKVDNSSKMGKQTVSILKKRLREFDSMTDCLETSTQWHKSNKWKVISTLQIQNRLGRKQEKTKGWSMIMLKREGVQRGKGIKWDIVVMVMNEKANLEVVELCENSVKSATHSWHRVFAKYNA